MRFSFFIYQPTNQHTYTKMVIKSKGNQAETTEIEKNEL